MTDIIKEKKETSPEEIAEIVGGKEIVKEEEKEEKKEEKKEPEKKEEESTDESEKEDETTEEETEEEETTDTDKEDEDEDESEESSEEDDEEGDDDEEEDELTRLKAQIAAQQKTIKEMLDPKKVAEVEEEEEEKEETKIEKKGKDYVFVEQKELDDAGIEVTAEFLNEFGNKIATQLKKDALTDTSRLVKSHIDETQKIRDLAASFYKKNPDLDKEDIKTFVGYRVNILASKHPSWGYEKLFSELGEDVRSKLGLKNLAKKIDDKRKKKPAFVKKIKSKSSVKKEEATSLSKEINELLPKG